MSLILDALRKSERARQQTLTGQLSAAGAPPARARLPVPWVMLVGILLAANAVVLTIILWHNRTNHPTPVVTAVHLPPRTVPSPRLEIPYRPAVRSLAVEAGAASSATPAATLSSAVMPSPGRASMPNRAPTQALLRVSGPPSATSVISPATQQSLGANTPPPLASLPLAFQHSFPTLHLNVHSYSRKPADRFVVINMQRYASGDTLKEGPKVIRIVTEGVILEYKGQEFLLPRP